MDAVIIAVPHDEFKLLDKQIVNLFYEIDAPKVLLDIKGVLEKKEYINTGYYYWRL